MKLKDKIMLKYFQTFQSLHPEAKAQISSGFQLLGAAIFLFGLFFTKYTLPIGGGIMTFGITMIITTRILFK